MAEKSEEQSLGHDRFCEYPEGPSLVSIPSDIDQKGFVPGNDDGNASNCDNLNESFGSVLSCHTNKCMFRKATIRGEDCGQDDGPIKGILCTDRNGTDDQWHCLGRQSTRMDTFVPMLVGFGCRRNNNSICHARGDSL